MAQLIAKFVGHNEQKQWLFDRWQSGDLPSSLIFQGAQGVGKRTLALALLQIMNCRDSEMACGTCSSCHRVLEERNELVYNLKPEGKKTIGVDQVREAHSFFQLKSMHKARFVIIDPADKLSVPAANSLLKVLEEAPENTYFILITDQMRSLLPTIRSRSHILNFANLSQQELAEYQRFNDLSLSWSDGRLQMALELEDEQKINQLNESIQLLYSVLCEHPTDWKKKAPWFFSNDEQREFCFNIWKQALTKRLYGESSNLDFIPQDPGSISQLFERTEKLKQDISANVDKLLSFENFYYSTKPVMLQQ